jgi:transketolase
MENKGKEERKMKENRKKAEVLLMASKQNLKESKEKRGKKMKRESTYLEDSTASDFILKAKLSTVAISRSEIIMVVEVIFPKKATGTISTTQHETKSSSRSSLLSKVYHTVISASLT